MYLPRITRNKNITPKQVPYITGHSATIRPAGRGNAQDLFKIKGNAWEDDDGLRSGCWIIQNDMEAARIGCVVLKCVALLRPGAPLPKFYIIIFSIFMIKLTNTLLNKIVEDDISLSSPRTHADPPPLLVNFILGIFVEQGWWSWRHQDSFWFRKGHNGYVQYCDVMETHISFK